MSLPLSSYVLVCCFDLPTYPEIAFTVICSRPLATFDKHGVVDVHQEVSEGQIHRLSRSAHVREWEQLILIGLSEFPLMITETGDVFRVNNDHERADCELRRSLENGH